MEGLKVLLQCLDSSGVTLERPSHVSCFCFLSRRDLKPENILLDDRGTFQPFSIQGSHSRLHVWGA